MAEASDGIVRASIPGSIPIPIAGDYRMQTFLFMVLGNRRVAILKTTHSSLRLDGCKERMSHLG